MRPPQDRALTAKRPPNTSQDPIRLEAGLTNLYAYVHDVNAWVDPWGLAGTGVPFQVGLYEDLVKVNRGTGLDAHHVGQKARMSNLVANYDLKRLQPSSYQRQDIAP